MGNGDSRSDAHWCLALIFTSQYMRGERESYREIWKCLILECSDLSPLSARCNNQCFRAATVREWSSDSAPQRSRLRYLLALAALRAIAALAEGEDICQASPNAQ